MVYILFSYRQLKTKDTLRFVNHVVKHTSSGEGAANVEPLRYICSVSVIVPRGAAKRPRMLPVVLGSGSGISMIRGGNAEHAGDVAGHLCGVHVRFRDYNGCAIRTGQAAYSAHILTTVFMLRIGVA